jgi:PBP1b-binding outer membrane lipoprotein LpoB
MKKFFLFLCILIIFIGIGGCPSSDKTPGISQSSSTSATLNPVKTSDADSIPINSDASPIPEPATVMLIGFGFVGIAVIGRKKFKK